MEESTAFSATAALLSDASRAAMLLAMLDGRAYTANELARAADIAPPTASFHLDKMLKAGLLAVVRQGRYRYFRLAGPDVARTLESILALQQMALPRPIVSSCPSRLREARTCFDHVAGALGVRIYRAITSRGWTTHLGAQFAVTTAATDFLGELGIAGDMLPVESAPCLDWSEREFHFSGEFGRLLLQAMLGKRWVLGGKSRLLTLTEAGQRQLAAWKI
jgi:DNA-binding transcriptional ArsR family regulator